MTSDWKLEDWFYSPRLSLAAFAFDQNDGEVAPAEGEPLLDVSGHRYLDTNARNTLPLAEHPHGSSTVVYLKDTRTHRSVGIGYTPCDRDLPACESAWVAINLLYALSTGTSRKQQRRETNEQQENNLRRLFVTHSLVILLRA